MVGRENNIQSLTLLTFSRQDAMAHLRVTGPAEWLGIRVLDGYENGVVHPDRIEEGQILVVQRDFPRQYDEYRQVMDLARRLAKPVVVDLDDLLLDLPAGHPDKQRLFFTQALLPMVEAISGADLVTVSTPAIKEYLSPLNENIVVLPNFFDDRLWQFRKPSVADPQRVVIGYMGGHTHLYDVRSILPAIQAILAQYPERLEFRFWGLKPPEELLSAPQVTWTIPDTLLYRDFAAYFQQQSADIFIGPLESNEFNSCKSSIKFFEYSALGAPGVFSDIEPYRQVVEHGSSGYLAASQEDWISHLSYLIENPVERVRVAGQAQAFIKNRWLLSEHAHLWRETYQDGLRHDRGKDLHAERARRLFGALNQELKTLHQREEETITSLRSETSRLDKQVRDHIHEILVLNSTVEGLNRDINRLAGTIEGQNRTIEELNGALIEKEKQNQTLSAELSEIKISKAWKLALFFRQLRVTLLPPNSFQFNLLRRMYHTFKELRVRSLTLRNSISKAQDVANPSDQPLVSVVIPIYDRTDLLIESIESILRQSLTNIELLLVCDGSPQASVDIVQSYVLKDSRVRAFFFKNNSGNAVRGRNKGIKEARGKYLAFQDSDDVADPDRLKISLQAMSEYNADVVYGGWRAIIDGTRDVGLQNNQEVFSPDCDLEFLRQICVPCQSTVMAKVDALRKVGGVNTKMRYREDHELWLRLAYHGYKFKAVQKVLTNLRLHQGNLEISLKDLDGHWQQMVMEEYTKKIVMPPKIGYVIPGTGISGGIAVVCEHANRLLLRGFDVSLITEDNSDSIPWFPNLLSDVIPTRNSGSNYDILVATQWMTAYAVNLLPAKRKFYLVQSDESRFYEQGDASIDLALKTYTLNLELITIAKWIQNWLKERFNRDCIYATNGINEEIVHPVEPIEEKKDRVRVLLEGPISIPFKGMEDAFKAVEGLDCEVWCVSSAGKPKSEWRCDRFFYQVPFWKMNEIYSSCDIILKMSRVESFSLPPLEMMACGGTAVLGEVTGIEEYAVHEYNALIVPQGDVQAARDALKRLIEDKELRLRLIENGKKTAAGRRWEPTIDILARLYSSYQDPS
jgi:glycosyltransferase involved in cell wall biosynthesis